MKSLISVSKMVFVWMIIIIIFAFIGWNRFTVLPDTAYSWIDARHLHTPSFSLLALPARWDSEWYLSIARTGYAYTDSQTLSNIVFFPVYPFLSRAMGWIVGQSVLGAWLVSLLSLWVGALMLWKLVNEFHRKLDPDEVVWFTLCFPTAIFFLGIYTESLFFALSVSSIYFMRKKQWGIASALGAVASLTRLTGVLLLLPMMLEIYEEWKKTKRFSFTWLTGLLMPLATLSFFAYHKMMYGSWMVFFDLQKTWGRGFALNKSHLYVATHPGLINLGLDILFVGVGIMAIVIIARSIRVSYAVYTLAGILVPLSSGTLMSIGRYELVLFPIAMALAQVKPGLKRILSTISVLFLALYTILFAHSYWAG